MKNAYVEGCMEALWVVEVCMEAMLVAVEWKLYGWWWACSKVVLLGGCTTGVSFQYVCEN